jgi:hypothetical protein
MAKGTGADHLHGSGALPRGVGRCAAPLLCYDDAAVLCRSRSDPSRARVSRPRTSWRSSWSSRRADCSTPAPGLDGGHGFAGGAPNWGEGGISGPP